MPFPRCWGYGTPVLMSASVLIYAPVLEGEAFDLSKVEDPVFADRQMGDGVAFTNNDNIIVAPCDGLISFVASTKHAFSMDLENGAEIFIHVGLDSVKLEGQGFDVLVKRGQSVKRGECLIKLDADYLIEKIGSLQTMLIVTREGYTIRDMKLGKVSQDPVFAIWAND